MATGASRPADGQGSHWHMFNDNNGVSGHAFIGAIPFLAAAEMVERVRASPAWQGLLHKQTLELHEMPGADHTFSNSSDLQALRGLGERPIASLGSRSVSRARWRSRRSVADRKSVV